MMMMRRFPPRIDGTWWVIMVGSASPANSARAFTTSTQSMSKPKSHARASVCRLGSSAGLRKAAHESCSPASKLIECNILVRLMRLVDGAGPHNDSGNSSPTDNARLRSRKARSAAVLYQPGAWQELRPAEPGSGASPGTATSSWVSIRPKSPKRLRRFSATSFAKRSEAGRDLLRVEIGKSAELPMEAHSSWKDIAGRSRLRSCPHALSCRADRTVRWIAALHHLVRDAVQLRHEFGGAITALAPR